MNKFINIQRISYSLCNPCRKMKKFKFIVLLITSLFLISCSGSDKPKVTVSGSMQVGGGAKL